MLEANLSSLPKHQPGSIGTQARYHVEVKTDLFASKMASNGMHIAFSPLSMRAAFIHFLFHNQNQQSSGDQAESSEALPAASKVQYLALSLSLHWP